MLQTLVENARRHAYAELGYRTLYEYLLKGCSFSSGSAYRYSCVASYCDLHPESFARLKTSEISFESLVSLALIVRTQRQHYRDEQVQHNRKTQKQHPKKRPPLLDPQVHTKILDSLSGKSAVEAQAILRSLTNLPSSKKSTIRALSGGGKRIQIDLTDEEFETITRIKEVCSNKVPSLDTKKVILYALERFLEREAPKKLPKQKSNIKPPTPIRQKHTSDMKRPRVPPAQRRRLLISAGYQCEFLSPITGKRCEARTHLDIDHIIPLSKGGSHTPANWRVLCASHNRIVRNKLDTG